MEDVNYQYTEKDVEEVLRFLRLHVPDYATPENAIKVLVYTREKSMHLSDIPHEEIDRVVLD